MRLLLVIDDPAWTDLSPGKSQVFRNRINERLRLIGDRIALCSQNEEGGVWKLEPSIEKPADEAADEAA